MNIEQNCDHPTLFDKLNKKAAVTGKINILHRVTRQSYDFIHRIGVADYDSKCDMLKTFAHSSYRENPPQNYQCKLSQAKTHYQLFFSDRKPRVVNDLSMFKSSHHEHARRIRIHNIRSSYTDSVVKSAIILAT